MYTCPSCRLEWCGPAGRPCPSCGEPIIDPFDEINALRASCERLRETVRTFEREIDSRGDEIIELRADCERLRARVEELDFPRCGKCDVCDNRFTTICQGCTRNHNLVDYWRPSTIWGGDE
jgi:hypothetical protein